MTREKAGSWDDAKALRPASGVKEAVMAKVGGEAARGEAGSPKEGATRTTHIGGFDILATLGRGGMDVVFNARQVPMDRIVTLNEMGEPVLLILVHTCGCFLAVVPTSYPWSIMPGTLKNASHCRA